MCHFLTEAGYDVIPRVRSDSSACLWIVRRTGTGRLKHLEIRHMWKQEELQIGEFFQKAVSTDDNVADLLTKHLAAARVEELLPKLGVRCLITRVEADHFDARADHVARVRIEHEVMLLVVECVVVVLALVVLAAAGAYCWWRWCCRDTATRVPRVFGEVRRCQPECHRDRVGVFSQAKADAILRDKLRVAFWRRVLPTRRGLKEDLIKRLLRVLPGLALTDGAGAIGWIVEACKKKSVHNDGRGAISDVRRWDETFEEPGCESRCEARVAL